MINQDCFVFQTDSKLVQEIYGQQPNYLIDYDEQCSKKEYCAIYFCSNDIYYPNSEEQFTKRIIQRNFFEWYNSRIEKAYKHIFIRDVFKQWYLKGINHVISTPEKLIDFLRNETKEFRVITVGSSAGGYAAILYGSILKAEKIMAFNPQFELKSLLKRSNEAINPLIFRLKDSERVRYYDILPFIANEENIYYFYSNQSQWDREQYIHSRHIQGMNRISFNTAHHGIPFLKVALPVVVNTDVKKLKGYANKLQSPLLFTIRLVGIRKATLGLLSQIYNVYRKRF